LKITPDTKLFGGKEGKARLPQAGGFLFLWS
jgi:hypothetical protein